MRLLALVLSIGCATTEYPPPDPLDDAYRACDAPSDCVIVQLGCCDHCNGGTAVAVNTTSRAEVEELYSERCRRNTACTLIGCATLVADCDTDGFCVAVEEELAD